MHVDEDFVVFPSYFFDMWRGIIDRGDVTIIGTVSAGSWRLVVFLLWQAVFQRLIGGIAFNFGQFKDLRVINA